MRRALLIVSLTLGTALAAAPAGAEIVPREVVVRFAPDAGRTAVTAALDAVDAEATSRLPVPDARLVELPEGESVAHAVARLNGAPGVAYAEPNAIVSATRVPDDPRFPGLWGLQNGGGVFGGITAVPGIDIGATAAWDTMTDARGAAVGVTDTGIMRDHPDLAANVDPAISRDFTAGSDADGDGDPFVDGNTHGTHVAGTIGGVGDNGIGVAGVAWRARMGALRVLTSAGDGTSANVAAGFAWAGAQGLPVVNASLGGPEYSQLTRDAIESSPNTLFVIAAGNEAKDDDAVPAYPCSYPSANILCVAAIAPDGSLADFSNWGALSVDVGAPGVAIDSTVPEQDLPYREAFLDPLAGRWTAGGGPGAWTREATLPDDPRVVPGDGTGSYSAGLDQTLTSDDPIAIGGRRGCTLIVGWESTVPDGNAVLSVETSTDGFAFEPIAWLPAVTRYTQRAYNLDDPAEPLWVRLRFATPPTLPQPAGAAPYVDRVAVRCLTGGAGYGVKSGTSMATPEVAGIAALVRTRQPGLTAVQARAAIMQSTRALPSLAGKTVTGGLTDLPAALARADAIAAGGGGGGGGGGTTAPPTVPETGPDNPDSPVTTQSGATAGPLAGGRLALAIAKRQNALRRGVSVSVTPVRTGTIYLSGQLRRGDTRVDLPQKARSVTAGREVTLRLKPGPRGRSLLRSARRDGRRVRAALALTFIGADGSRTTVNRGGVYVG